MKTFLFLALCLATCVQAAGLRGRVVAVSDGDTVTVLDAERRQYKVRLAGIDAPEKAQAFGQASKISLSDQIFGREVAVTTCPAPKPHLTTNFRSPRFGDVFAETRKLTPPY